MDNNPVIDNLLATRAEIEHMINDLERETRDQVSRYRTEIARIDAAIALLEPKVVVASNIHHDNQ